MHGLTIQSHFSRASPFRSLKISPFGIVRLEQERERSNIDSPHASADDRCSEEKDFFNLFCLNQESNVFSPLLPLCRASNRNLRYQPAISNFGLSRQGIYLLRRAHPIIPPLLLPVRTLEARFVYRVSSPTSTPTLNLAVFVFVIIVCPSSPSYPLGRSCIVVHHKQSHTLDFDTLQPFAPTAALVPRAPTHRQDSREH